MPGTRSQYSIGAAAVVAAVTVGFALGRGADPHPPGALGASPAQQADQSPREPDEAAFWQMIADTRGAAGNDTGRQADLLEARLEQAAPQKAAGFARIHHRLDQRAYTWRLWGAAHMIEDGCSDDCFLDFRAYLISLGRGPYEQALADPDSLASFAEDREAGNWEDAFVPDDEPDLEGEPRGTPFNEDDDAGLARRYPRLAARFR
jgi:hypothetical protein